MQITNLENLKKYLRNSTLWSMIILLLTATVLIILVNIKLSSTELQMQNHHLEEAINTFKSNLSEELSIVASSTTFINYLRSGEITRQQEYPSFLAHILFIKNKSITGMEITDATNNLLFSSGQKTDSFATVKICYLNGQLDEQYGNCEYRWKLYFSKTGILDELRKTHSEIEECKYCTKVNIFSDNNFGNLTLDQANDMTLTVRAILKHDPYFPIYGIIFFGLIIFSLWNQFKMQKVLDKYITHPLELLTRNLANNAPLNTHKEDIAEIGYLAQQIAKSKEKEREAKIGKMAIQLAHDIRSPLTALQLVVKQTTNIDEENRTIIRNATTRINDIANNLLAKYRDSANKNNGQEEQNEQNNLSIEPIASTIDNIISEKRIQFSAKNLKIQTLINSDLYNIFAKINIGNFKRVISNLFDNSVEALFPNKQGLIIISLNKEADNILIEIIDNGQGMPETTLSKIGKEKVTSGKTYGTGMGLLYAVAQIKKWNGDYEIQSTIGEGTTFLIKLPISPPPAWYQQSITIVPNMNIISLDDEISIHNVWAARFKDYIIYVKLFHFFKTDEFQASFETIKNENNIYLIDYELFNSPETGVELIDKLKINNNAFLVTSHYEDLGLRKQCLEKGIKIIPKNFVPYIPIEFITNKNMEELDCIFIDDDKNLTDAWLALAKTKNVKIKVFNNINDFKHVANLFDKNTKIYIDSKLGNIKGEEFAKTLYDAGFCNIYLATGYDRENFVPMYWIKDIVDKTPPF